MMSWSQFEKMRDRILRGEPAIPEIKITEIKIQKEMLDRMNNQNGGENS